jgi:chemotaxis protein MotA
VNFAQGESVTVGAYMGWLMVAEFQMPYLPAMVVVLIGSALVGTFLGVFLAYGIVEPFASRFTQVIDEEGEMPKVVKQIIIGTLHGHPMPLIIEAARACVSHHNQPTFAEVFDGMRGK